MKVCLTAFIIILLYSLPVLALDYSPVTLPSLNPSPSLSQAMQVDAPFESLVLADDGSLWMLGKSYLWRWYPVTGSLKKIDLGLSLPMKGPNRTIAEFKGVIYLAVDGKIWRYQIASDQVQPLSGGWSKACAGNRFVVNEQFVLLVNQCGAFQIDPKKAAITVLSVPSSLTKLDFALAAEQCACFFGATGKQLVRYSIFGADVTEEIIYRAKARILGVHSFEGKLAAWTEHALLAFDIQSGQRLQVVPNIGGRKLKAAAFTKHLHLIAFNDGVLEIMVPSTKKAWATKIRQTDFDGILLDPAGAFAIVKSKSLPVGLGLGRAY